MVNTRSKMEDTMEIIYRKRKYKERLAWTDKAEELLVEMWEQKILQLRSNRKNQHVYAEIAADMEKNNYSVSTFEVKNKIHNLTKRYRKEKLLVGPAGESSSRWPLYSRLYRLLGSYKYFNISDITCDTVSAPSAASTEAPETESFTSKTILDENLSSNHINSEVSESENYYEDIADLDDSEDDQQDVINENEVIDCQTETPKDLKPKYQAVNEGEIKTSNSDVKFQGPSDEQKEATLRSRLSNEQKYLRSINRNLELLIELHKRSEQMERNNTATLQQLLNVIKPVNITEELTANNEEQPRKKKYLNNTHDNYNEKHYQQFANIPLNDDDPLYDDNLCEKKKHESLLELLNEDDANPPTSTSKSKKEISLNIKIKEECLKIKKLESQFMLEKHNLEMDILKIELQAKKKFNGL